MKKLAQTMGTTQKKIEVIPALFFSTGFIPTSSEEFSTPNENFSPSDNLHVGHTIVFSGYQQA